MSNKNILFSFYLVKTIFICFIDNQNIVEEKARSKEHGARGREHGAWRPESSHQSLNHSVLGTLNLKLKSLHRLSA